MDQSFRQEEKNVLTTVKTEARDIRSELHELRRDIKLWLSAITIVFLLFNAAALGMVVAHIF
ncbi:hypothetical protein DK867_15935 [Ochrobactrum sp. POC9]|nr:hypothetical protein DK867_15935 [Ochrobactrum sp. POC9]